MVWQAYEQMRFTVLKRAFMCPRAFQNIHNTLWLMGERISKYLGLYSLFTTDDVLKVMKWKGFATKTSCPSRGATAVHPERMRMSTIPSRRTGRVPVMLRTGLLRICLQSDRYTN